MGIRSAFSEWCLERGQTSLILHSVIVFTFTSSCFECRKLWTKNEQLWNVIFKPCFGIKIHRTTARVWEILFQCHTLVEACPWCRSQSFLPFTQHLYMIWGQLLDEEDSSCLLREMKFDVHENGGHLVERDGLRDHVVTVFVTFSSVCFLVSTIGIRSAYFTVVHLNKKGLDIILIRTVKTIFICGLSSTNRRKLRSTFCSSLRNLKLVTTEHSCAKIYRTQNLTDFLKAHKW